MLIAGDPRGSESNLTVTRAIRGRSDCHSGQRPLIFPASLSRVISDQLLIY